MLTARRPNFAEVSRNTSDATKDWAGLVQNIAASLHFLVVVSDYKI